jgi:hypothetical protein
MKTEELTLINIVDLIDHTLLLLPAFQRNFVWDDDKIKLLFDSLITGIPVGAVTLAIPSFSIGAAIIDKNVGAERGKTPDFSYYTAKQFNELGKNGSAKLGGAHECRLILDGQQRITSIYRVLHSSPRLYLSVPADVTGFKSIPQLSQAVEEISLSDSEKKMCISPDTARRQASEKELREEFLSTKYGKACFESGEERFGEEFDRFCGLTRNLFNVFVDKARIPCITSEAKEESLIQYFERSNTQGEALTFYDLLNAKTFQAFKGTKWKSLTAARQKLMADLEPDCRVPKFDENFIRAKTYEQVKKLAGKNALNKGTILEHVDADKLKTRFEESWCDFCFPIRWLHAAKMATAHDAMPFPLMLLPLFFFLKAHSFKSQNVSAPKKKVVSWWYWASVFSERYSYRTNEAAEEDIELLSAVAKSSRPKKIFSDDYIARLSNRLERPEQILALTASTGHFQRAILQLGLFLHNSADPFTGDGIAGMAIRKTKKGGVRKIDYHHIFPTAYCVKEFGSEAFGNKICNIMYATEKTHRGDGDAPSEYLARWKKEKKDHGLLVGHFMNKEMVKSLASGDFDKKAQEFFIKRAEIICADVKQVVSATNIQAWRK